MDCVLDHLHNDITTLKTCTLVCRTWIPASRYHLFEEIRCSPELPGKHVEDLSQWIADSPEVVPFIRSLLVTGDGNKFFHNGVPIATLGPSIPVFIEDLLPVLLACPNLRSVRLKYIQISSRKPINVPYNPPATLACLDRLSIITCSAALHTFQPIYRLLSLFDRIEEFQIHDYFGWLHWDSSMALPHLVFPLQSSPRIYGMTEIIGRYSTYALIHLFRLTPPRQRVLRSISFSVSSPLTELVEVCQLSLTEIKIDLVALTLRGSAVPFSERFMFPRYTIR